MRAVDFKEYILERFFQDIRKTQHDNYSAERFGYDGIDRSALFDVAKHAANLDWFTAEHANIFDAYRNLADQESRNLYIDLLRFKLAGHLHVRIDAPVARLEAERTKFLEVFPGTESALHVSGMFGELRHYDGLWNDTRYTVDTLSNAIAATLVNRQYYFARNGVTIGPEPGDYLIDGGVCTGDTAIVFSRSVGPQGKVYAFDPVQSHLEVCSLNFSRPDYGNVELLPYGLSDRRVDAPPVRLETYSPGFRADGIDVPLARIDDLVIDRQIERIDFIKLDIEGSELAALRGAVASIHRFKPRLAISIYHKPNDFFEICQYLNGLHLGYEFYLGHYTIWDEETVLYAACPNSEPVAVNRAAAAPLTASGHIDDINVIRVTPLGADCTLGAGCSAAIVRIRGWATISEDPSRAAGVYVSIDHGAPLEALTGLERPDVAEFFNRAGLAACGFRAVISAAHLCAGSHGVTLMVRDDIGLLIPVEGTANFSINVSCSATVR